jgi:very-short-patch-repair endonuclease
MGLDIDIYIPELRKGIEFDGDYWHSFEGLKRGRPDWPEEDLERYHQIKDRYFLSKGIEILHINEKEWLENHSKCLQKINDFLNLKRLSSD